MFGNFELFGKHMALRHLDIAVQELVEFCEDDSDMGDGGFVGEFIEKQFDMDQGVDAMKYLVVELIHKYHNLDKWYGNVVKRIEKCSWFECDEQDEWFELKKNAKKVLNKKTFSKKKIMEML